MEEGQAVLEAQASQAAAAGAVAEMLECVMIKRIISFHTRVQAAQVMLEVQVLGEGEPEVLGDVEDSQALSLLMQEAQEAQEVQEALVTVEVLVIQATQVHQPRVLVRHLLEEILVTLVILEMQAPEAPEDQGEEGELGVTF